jgi:cytochrome b561
MTASFRNTEQCYGMVAIVLHWGMAALLITLIALGFYMVSLPDAGFDTHKITLILIHKEVGVLVLALATIRLAWRISNALPALVENLPDWQKVVARFVHLSFYGLMLALPVTGWLMSSAAGIPVSVFGMFTLPDLISHDEYVFHIYIDMHRWLGYALVALIFVHAGAALRHHFILNDETLKKMLPHAHP